LDWLNEKTPDGIHLFGLEIELWRIGESPVAPWFNVVCKPNDWARSLASAGRPSTEQSRFRWEYWSEFVKQPAILAVASRAPEPNRQGNLPIPTRWRNFVLQVSVGLGAGSSAVYVSCRGDGRFLNLERLLANRAEIERVVAAPLKWTNVGAMNRAWITLDVEGIDPSRREDWPRQQEVLAGSAARLWRALDPFIRAIDHVDS
jgi:hypothetical protein